MIQDDIREHLRAYKPSLVFNYGRSFDTALEAAKTSIEDWFCFLDPVVFNGTVGENESANVLIGFLKQDSPHSQYDVDNNLEIDLSIEEIQKEAHQFAVAWLNDFLGNYKYSVGNYTLNPLTRVKNVMSGKSMSVTFNYKPAC